MAIHFSDIERKFREEHADQLDTSDAIGHGQWGNVPGIKTETSPGVIGQWIDTAKNLISPEPEFSRIVDPANHSVTVQLEQKNKGLNLKNWFPGSNPVLIRKTEIDTSSIGRELDRIDQARHVAYLKLADKMPASEAWKIASRLTDEELR